jgi:hypothetical protein
MAQPTRASGGGGHINMGYDLHITRGGDHWSSNVDVEITLDEWRRYLQIDSEFERIAAAEAVNPTTHEVIRIEQPGIAKWLQHSSGDPVWFSWWHGNVIVKNPDEEVIRKMHQVASQLNAHVQGDDGEWCDDGQVEVEPREHVGSSKDDAPLGGRSGRKPMVEAVVVMRRRVPKLPAR